MVTFRENITLVEMVYSRRTIPGHPSSFLNAVSYTGRSEHQEWVEYTINDWDQSSKLSADEPNWSTHDIDKPYTWCIACFGQLECTCATSTDDPSTVHATPPTPPTPRPVLSGRFPHHQMEYRSLVYMLDWVLSTTLHHSITFKPFTLQ